LLHPGWCRCHDEIVCLIWITRVDCRGKRDDGSRNASEVGIALRRHARPRLFDPRSDICAKSASSRRGNASVHTSHLVGRRCEADITRVVDRSMSPSIFAPVISLKHDRTFYVASKPHRCSSGSRITCDGVIDSPYLLGTYPDPMLSTCIDLSERNWYATRRLTTVKLELTVWQ
jgi:hypothetical protein